MAMQVVTAVLTGNVARATELAGAAAALDLAQRQASTARRSEAGRVAALRRWTDAKPMPSPCEAHAIALPSHKERISNALATHDLGISNASESHAGVGSNSSPDPESFPDLSSPKSAIVSIPSKLLPEKPGRLRSTRGRAEPPQSAETWASYGGAYQARYGVEPVRNARVNSQMAQVVQRLGQEDAPSVAAYFVRLNTAWYVQQGHSVGALLHDAEKLRTEWATGRRATATAARELDRRDARATGHAAVLARLEAEDREAGRV